MSYKASIKSLFRFISPNWFEYFFGILAYSSQGFAYPYCMGLLTSWISDAMLNGTGNDLIHAIVKFGVLFFIVIVVTGVGIYSLFMVRHKAEGRMKRHVLSNFLYAGIENNSRHAAGISALNKEINRALELYDNATSDVLGCIISVSFSLCSLMSISWKLGLMSIVVGIGAFIQQAGFIYPRKKLEEERFTGNRLLINLTTNILRKIPSIRAYCGESQVENNFSERNRSILETYIAESLTDLKQSFVGGFQNMIVIICVWGIGGYLVSTGEISFPSLVMAPFMANALSNGISGISSSFSYIQGPLVACRNLESLLSVKKEEKKKKLTDWSQWDGNTSIRISDLSFCYNNSDKLALDNISLFLPSNKMIAIVGKSGSGKTTLLRTIIGLYDRTKLPISLGNLSFDDMKRSAWKEKFAFVPQTNHLFNMTIADNIRLGNGGLGSQEDIEKITNSIGADDFIRNLPKGYDTLLGKDKVELSGGQSKLITIAMAILRNAPIIVLDEPTAALDEKSSGLIKQALNKIRGEKTILFSSHDLDLASKADLVIVLQDGRVVQIGSHDQLISTKGEYKDIHRFVDKDAIIF